jgi:hypothetical protein
MNLPCPIRRERVRLGSAKTRMLCPSDSKPARFQDSLSSGVMSSRLPSEKQNRDIDIGKILQYLYMIYPQRNRARSAFKRFSRNQTFPENMEFFRIRKCSKEAIAF